MSFKQTNEGRVFFKGGTETPVKPAAPSKPAQQAKAAQSVSSTQIISLLKALNQKLQTSQAEREDMRAELDRYRRSVESLTAAPSDKTAQRAELVAAEAIKELKEARRLILKIETKADRVDDSVASLKSQVLQTRQQHKNLAEQYDGVKQSIDDTKAEQARIARQIEKANEDRIRFMRKMERIEEVVLQTQDSLSAKAMVLLTDQGASENEHPLDMDADGRIAADTDTRRIHPANDAERAPWWEAIKSQHVIIGAGAIGALMILGVAISLMNNPLSQKTSSQSRDFSNYQIAEESLDPPPIRVPIERQPAFDAPEQPVQRYVPAPSPAQNQDQDIGIDLSDDQEILKLLQENPEALARELNAIEPSIVDLAAQAQPEATAPIASPAPAPKQEVKAPPAAPIPAPKTTDRATLEKRLSFDKSLPADVQPIQEQAYNGVPEAQHDLAAIYTAGPGDIKQSFKRAAFWFERSAEQNIPNAAYNLGVLNHQGLGTDKNMETAIKWYQKAANLGHPEAQYNLGIAFIEGVGVPYDPAQATHYFEQAAEQGVTEAAYNLGLISENGLLGDPQPDVALMWYKTAADKGSPEAKRALEELAKSLEIKLDDVNRIADSMSTLKKTKKLAPAPLAKATQTQVYSSLQGKSPVNGDQAVTAQVQEYLMRAGLYPGPADGANGPILQDAIRSYQSQNGMEKTGLPAKDLLAHMMANDQEYGSRE